MKGGRVIKLALLGTAFTAAYVVIFIHVFRPLGYPHAPPTYLLANVDSLLFFSSFHAARDFGSVADLQAFAFGQGFGAFQHPALFNLFWWLLDWTTSAELTYLITEFLVFASVFAFAHFVSGSLIVSGLAAFFATAFFFVPALFVDHFGPTAPQAVLQIAFAYLALAAIGFGLRRRVWMIAGFGILLYAVIMDWMYFIFVIPFVGLCLVAFALTATVTAQRKETPGAWAWLLTGAAVTVGLVYASGIPDAYDYFTLMSVRGWWSGGLLPEYPRSLLIWGGVTHQPVAIVVGILAILSMVYLTWRRERLFVFLCPGVLALLALLALADIDSTGVDIYWTLPALGYFERPLIPFYAVVIVCALARLARHAPLRFPVAAISDGPSDLNALRPAALALLLVASAAAAIVVVFVSVVISGRDLRGLIHRPPYRWERAAEFVKGLPVPRSTGAQFAPYFLDATKEQLINDCPQLHDPGQPPRGRYCGYMLNFYSARNFFEPHNLADIQNEQMLAAALATSRQASGRDAANSGADRRDGLAALKSFGVRYVAVDGVREHALGAREFAGRIASLVDLGPITAENLSARSVAFAGAYGPFEAVTARLSGRAVVHDQRVYERIGALVPASDFSLEYRPGAVAIAARSAGESLLLLPFQFSNCLRLSQTAGEGAELIRANGGQAALHFAGRADVHVGNALTYFGDRSCRRRDFADVFRLGIWPVQSFDDLAQGRRVPLLMGFYLDARLRFRDRIMGESEAETNTATQ
jgi:hypothetical protein